MQLVGSTWDTWLNTSYFVAYKPLISLSSFWAGCKTVKIQSLSIVNGGVNAHSSSSFSDKDFFAFWYWNAQHSRCKSVHSKVNTVVTHSPLLDLQKCNGPFLEAGANFQSMVLLAYFTITKIVPFMYYHLCITRHVGQKHISAYLMLFLLHYLSHALPVIELDVDAVHLQTDELLHGGVGLARRVVR